MGGLFLICWAYTMKDSDLLARRSAARACRTRESPLALAGASVLCLNTRN